MVSLGTPKKRAAASLLPICTVWDTITAVNDDTTTSPTTIATTTTELFASRGSEAVVEDVIEEEEEKEESLRTNRCALSGCNQTERSAASVNIQRRPSRSKKNDDDDDDEDRKRAGWVSAGAVGGRGGMTRCSRRRQQHIAWMRRGEVTVRSCRVERLLAVVVVVAVVRLEGTKTTLPLAGATSRPLHAR